MTIRIGVPTTLRGITLGSTISTTLKVAGFATAAYGGAIALGIFAEIVNYKDSADAICQLIAPAVKMTNTIYGPLASAVGLGQSLSQSPTDDQVVLDQLVQVGGSAVMTAVIGGVLNLVGNIRDRAVDRAVERLKAAPSAVKPIAHNALSNLAGLKSRWVSGGGRPVVQQNRGVMEATDSAVMAKLKDNVNPTYIGEIKEAAVAPLSQATVRNLVEKAASTGEAWPVTQKNRGVTDINIERDAQMVADFLALNHNLLSFKVRENLRGARPELKNLLADTKRMATIDSAVMEKLKGINPTYIQAVKDTVAESLHPSDRAAAPKQHTVSKLTGPESRWSTIADSSNAKTSAHDRTDLVPNANLYSEYLDLNPTFISNMARENLRWASPELRIVLADPQRMDAIESTVMAKLKGINPAHTYLQEAKDAAIDFRQTDLAAVPKARPSVLNSSIERDAQMVADFLALNHNMLLLKVHESLRAASPVVRNGLADSDAVSPADQAAAPEVDVNTASNNWHEEPDSSDEQSSPLMR
ncbi:MAG: hypothetical protein K2X55_22790 [Burkholderiaceae bacterium]|nr:hypothetical protein [Burkholderiaceae bacterium]